MAEQILLPREAALWVTEETTVGTCKLPAAADAVAVVGRATLNQAVSRTDSEEVADSRSILAQALDMTGAGEWSFTTYLRPSGTAGTAPVEDALMEGLLGTGTNTPGTSEAYTCATTQKSYTIAYKVSNVALFAIGAAVDAVEITAEKSGYFTAAWSGPFLRLAWAGESTLNGAVDGDPVPVATCVVADSTQFSVGAFIQIGTDDNADAGYRITAVDTATHTLTVTPSIDTDQSSGAAVSYFLPAHTLPTSTAAEARNTTVTWAGTATSFRSLKLIVANGTEALTEEVTTSGFPEALAEGMRKVSGNLAIVARTTDLKHLTAGFATSTIAASIVNSGGAGKIITISLPYVQPGTPQFDEAGPTVGMSIDFTAIASSSGEDEISVTYT